MITISLYDGSKKIEDLSHAYDFLTFTTQLNGGFGTCTMRIGNRIWSSYAYLEDRLFARVIIRDGGFVLFDGRLAVVTVEPGQTTLNFEGYYAHGNDVFLDLQYPLTTAVYAQDVIEDCIDSSTLWSTTKVHIPNTTDLPTPQVNVADVDYMDDWHLNDVIDDVCKLGSTAGKPVFFAIWEDKEGHFFEYPGLGNIDWHIDEYNFVGGQQGYASSRDATKFGNKIAVIYSSGQGIRDITAETTDDTSISMYGTIQRRMSIAGAASATAIVLRDLTINEMSEPVQSVSLMVEGHIRNSNISGIVPCSHIRAGDIVMLHVDPRAGGGSAYDKARVVLVKATNYNVRTGRMQLELETNPNTLDVILSWFGLSGGRLI